MSIEFLFSHNENFEWKSNRRLQSSKCTTYRSSTCYLKSLGILNFMPFEKGLSNVKDPIKKIFCLTCVIYLQSMVSMSDARCQIWLALFQIAVPADSRYSVVDIGSNETVVYSEISCSSRNKHEWCKITRSLNQSSAMIQNKRYSKIRGIWAEVSCFFYLICCFASFYLQCNVHFVVLPMLLSSLKPDIVLFLIFSNV